jgi:hypothetical protein
MAMLLLGFVMLIIFPPVGILMILMAFFAALTKR